MAGRTQSVYEYIRVHQVVDVPAHPRELARTSTSRFLAYMFSANTGTSTREGRSRAAACTGTGTVLVLN
eukprot:scaffold108646_cov17-Prasinocladus_malaysianus.AAC.1